MKFAGAANCNALDIGVEVVEQNGLISLNLDLFRIDEFKAKFGDDIFLEQATRYVEQRAKALCAESELWLWQDAIVASVGKSRYSSRDPDLGSDDND